jgi:aminoglycoside 3-N-acetyltransferase
MLTKADIHQFLKENGIKKTDTVLVHTSMRAIGEVEGGCDGLIDGFISYLTEGLFIVPTHTWREVGKKQPVFDVRESIPCIGALPTVAAFRKDGVRSLHPTHSVAAFGKRAAAFVAGEENARTPCPPNGVWGRLLTEQAKILLLGVGLTRNTYIHAVDEMLGLPDRLTEPITLTVVDYEGKAHCLDGFCKHGNGGSEYFDNYRLPMIYCDALTFGKLGNALVGIFDTVKGTEMLKQLWAQTDCDLCRCDMVIPEAYYKK